MNDYKKNILNMFNNLTEIEMKASFMAAKENPEYEPIADCYNLAVLKCRNILEIILEGTNNG
jgi:hypothetical protein